MDYRIGHLTLRSHRQLRDGARPLAIGRKALEILSVLAEADGAVVTKDELMTAVWSGVIVEENALHVHIAAIRRVLGGAAEQLVTVHGIGYQLWADRVATPTAPIATPSAHEPLIAVLRFESLAAAGEPDWFAQGVAEEILVNVSRIPGVRTIARTSSFQLGDDDRTAHAAAAQLGATHVIEGSVRRQGDRLRITAHLIAAPAGTTVWNDAFDGTMDDLIAVQAAVADAVAIALRRQFAQAPRVSRVDPRAYDLYLEGRQIADVHSSRSVCIAFYRKAVEIDPCFVDAWGALALTLAQSVRWDADDRPFEIRAREAREAAERAFALDPNAPNAHLALGLLEPFAHYEVREQFLVKAWQSGTSHFSGDTLRQFGEFVFSVGRANEGIGHYEESWRVDRLNPRVVESHCFALANLGLFPEAYEAYRHARRKWPDFWTLQFEPILLAAMQRDWAEVDAILSEPGCDRPGVQLAVRVSKALRNPTPQVREINLQHANALLAQHGRVDQSMLIFLHALGLRDEAFDLADRSSYDYLFRRDGCGRDGIGFHTGIIFTQGARAMRADPRFVRLCTRLGLSAYWAKTGKWPDFADEVGYDLRAEVFREVAAVPPQ